jgi:putative flippase GtrA
MKVTVTVTPSHLREGFRYLVMSGLSAFLSLGIPFTLHEGFAVRPDIAVAIGLATAFVMNFIVAKLFVFRKKGPVKKEVTRFSLVSFAFRLSEYLAFLLLHNVFGIQYMVANASVLFISFCIKFFVYKLFVFSHRDKQYQAA